MIQVSIYNYPYMLMLILYKTRQVFIKIFEKFRQPLKI